jgi:hypothetical protein
LSTSDCHRHVICLSLPPPIMKTYTRKSREYTPASFPILSGCVNAGRKAEMLYIWWFSKSYLFLGLLGDWYR